MRSPSALISISSDSTARRGSASLSWRPISARSERIEAIAFSISLDGCNASMRAVIWRSCCSRLEKSTVGALTTATGPADFSVGIEISRAAAGGSVASAAATGSRNEARAVTAAPSIHQPLLPASGVAFWAGMWRATGVRSALTADPAGYASRRCPHGPEPIPGAPHHGRPPAAAPLRPPAPKRRDAVRLRRRARSFRGAPLRARLRDAAPRRRVPPPDALLLGQSRGRLRGGAPLRPRGRQPLGPPLRAPPGGQLQGAGPPRQRERPLRGVPLPARPRAPLRNGARPRRRA